MMNIQHAKDCGHCERNNQTCAMFLVPTADLGEEVFFLCAGCVHEAAAAVTAALGKSGQHVHTVEIEPVNVSGGCRYCGVACVNEACDDCARREHPQ